MSLATILAAQEIDTSLVQTDTTQAMTVPLLDTMAVAVQDTLPPDSVVEAAPPMELDYGYKGYAWGTFPNVSPRWEQMDTLYYAPDSSRIMTHGKLGKDEVDIMYCFADSGFWKVEIDFKVDNLDLDEQIKFFLRLELNLSEVHGTPRFTTQVQAGPSADYTNVLAVKYARAYYRSTWDKTPVMIDLILYSLVQVPHTELPILQDNPSVLKLVYYNPDYQIRADEVTPETPLPSIYELY
jgi:hypothetical protein